MAQFTPPSSDSNDTFRTEVATAFAVVNSYQLNGTEYKMIAKTVTTTTEVRGLSRSQALAYGSSSDYNYRNKHGVRFWSGSSIGTGSWMYTPDCEGVECVAHPRRINDADMWRVVISYSSTTVSHSAGWTKETV